MACIPNTSEDFISYDYNIEMFVPEIVAQLKRWGKTIKKKSIANDMKVIIFLKKLQIIKRVISNNEKISNLSKEFQISKRTIQKWCKKEREIKKINKKLSQNI
jgi:hypothetical protein